MKIKQLFLLKPLVFPHAGRAAQRSPNAADQPMLNFLQRYESHGNEEQALGEAVGDEWPPNSVYGSLANFFALFARERLLGSWKTGPTGAVYSNILGPSDTVLAPTAAPVAVSLENGEVYNGAGSVSAFGTDYFRFGLGATTAGRTLNVKVDGAAGGNFSYYLIWYKDSTWKSATFPFAVTTDYSLSQKIDLTTVNRLVIALSGRGIGGSYTINASVV